MPTGLMPGDSVRVPTGQGGVVKAILPPEVGIREEEFAVIHFGVQDGADFTGEYPVSDLERVERPVQPEELLRREANRAPASHLDTSHS